LRCACAWSACGGVRVCSRPRSFNTRFAIHQPLTHSLLHLPTLPQQPSTFSQPTLVSPSTCRIFCSAPPQKTDAGRRACIALLLLPRHHECVPSRLRTRTLTRASRQPFITHIQPIVTTTDHHLRLARLIIIPAAAPLQQSTASPICPLVQQHLQCHHGCRGHRAYLPHLFR